MNKTATQIASGAGIVACVLLAAFASGFTALLGSCLGGLQEGGWNWQFMPPLFLGWLGGLLITAICAVALPKEIKLPGILFIAPIFTAIAGACFYFVNLAPQRGARADYYSLESKSKSDPAFIPSLIDKSRHQSLTDNERQIIWQALGKDDTIPAKDIDYLLDYFKDDISGIAMLISNQKVSPTQLRKVYLTYKDVPGGASWRINHDLLEIPSTPSDIVAEIKTHQRAEQDAAANP